MMKTPASLLAALLAAQGLLAQVPMAPPGGDPDYYQVRYGGLIHPPAPPPRKITIPNVGAYMVLKGDFHIHTIYSDGTQMPVTRVREAVDNGLDVISLTDHIEGRTRNAGGVKENHNEAYERALPEAERRNILLVRGGEITRGAFHANAIFLSDVNAVAAHSGDWRKMFAEAAAQGGFIFWNHPYWPNENPEPGTDSIKPGEPMRFLDCLEEARQNGLLHGIEVFSNSACNLNPIAHDWCVERDLAVLANTDLHPGDLERFGRQNPLRPMTLVLAKERTVESVREAFFARRTVGWAADMIFGRQPWVEQLFHACVVATEIENGLLLRNNSDIPCDFEIGGATLRLPPLGTLEIPRVETLTVANWFVGTRKPLVTTVAAIVPPPPPKVAEVTLVRPHGTQKAQVSYTTDATGIATFQFMTNGVEIVHSEIVRTVAGDINKLLPAGAHGFTWDAMRDFPERLLENLTVEVTLWSPANPPPYCAASLVMQDGRYPLRWYGKEAEVPFGANHGWWKKDWLLLRKIPSTDGRFVTHGSPPEEIGRNSGREQRHQVRLNKAYYMGVFPVTQRQYDLVMGARPSWFNNADCHEERPVETVRYDVIRGTVAQGANWPATGSFVAPDSFMGRLRDRTGGLLAFDLPTEAQWEHACRAGTAGAWNNGTTTTSSAAADPNLNLLGRYARNGGQTPDGSAWTDPPRGCADAHGTAKVGSHLPNAWGVYDMHGNVRELCLNWTSGNANSAENPDFTMAGDDPKGPMSGTSRVIRGGHWGENAVSSRSARRGQQSATAGANGVGFRVAAAAEVAVAQ